MAGIGFRNFLTLRVSAKRYALFENTWLITDGAAFPVGTVIYFGEHTRHLWRGSVEGAKDGVAVLKVLEYQLPSKDPYDQYPVEPVCCPTFIIMAEVDGNFSKSSSQGESTPKAKKK